MNKFSKPKLRNSALSTAGGAENMALLGEGVLDFAQTTSTDWLPATSGTGRYAGNPVKAYQMFSYTAWNLSPMVSADSGIKTLDDLVGKRVMPATQGGATTGMWHTLFKAAAITPPVAIAALIASNIAKADFFKTAVQSVRLGLPGFVLPFLFITNPELLGLEGTFADQLIFAVRAFVAIMVINLMFEGYFLKQLTWWEKCLLAVTATSLLYPGWITTLAGIAALSVVTIRQIVETRKIAAV